MEINRSINVVLSTILLVTASSCSQDGLNENIDNGSKTLTVDICANATRVAGSQSGTESAKFTWEAEDALLGYTAGGQSTTSKFTLVEGDGAASASFKGEVDAATTSVRFVYPHSQSNVYSLATQETQSFGKCSVMQTNEVEIVSGKVVDAITMKHLTSTLRLNATFSDVAAGATLKSIAVTGMDNTLTFSDDFSTATASCDSELSTITLNVGAEAISTDAPYVDYLTVLSNKEAATLNFVATIEVDGKEQTLTAEKELAAGAIAQGMFYEMNLTFAGDAAVEYHPYILLKFPQSCGTATSSKQTKGFINFDGYKYMCNEVNTNWGLLIRNGGRSGDSTSHAVEFNLKNIDSQYPEIATFSLFTDEPGFTSQLVAPDPIKSGDKRFFAFSTNVNSSAFNVAEHPKKGVCSIAQIMQTRSTNITGEDLPIVEMGWNENDVFGVTVRGGLNKSNCTEQFIAVEGVPYQVAWLWMDYVIEFEYAPNDATGYVKVYYKSKNDGNGMSMYKTVELDNIQIGYSDAPSSIANANVGYTGFGTGEKMFPRFGALGYSDLWIACQDKFYIE